MRSEPHVRKLSEHIEALEPGISELHLKRCGLDTMEGVEILQLRPDLGCGINLG